MIPHSSMLKLHGMNKTFIKKELKRLFKSMDFVSERFLCDDKSNTKEFKLYFNIYQQLGLAWEFLSLQCLHWDGYRRARDKKEVCKICGKVKDVADGHCLLPRDKLKTIGRRTMPNSRKTFENKSEATLIKDTIKFHGAILSVDVHNSYKSSVFGKEINMAAERIVELKERGITCSIDPYLTHVALDNKKGKKKYGGFPWELTQEHLKKFPVIFDFDEDYNLLGLTILR